jgi:protein O-mannosyl-transferase
MSSFSVGFTPVERCLIAGRVVWFYLAKLLWPADLLFIYPRWEISQAAGWQYLYPLSALALLLGLWLLRNRSRAPLAALLFSWVTLFPVLGFFNVYFFRFSFVADHFQYVASLGPITLLAAGVAVLSERSRVRPGAAVWVVTVVVAFVLGTRTWHQSRLYSDRTTLYTATLAGNPDCWMVHNNLGVELAGQKRFAEAIVHFKEALRVKPDHASAYANWGNVLQELGRLDEAIESYEKALQLDPNHADTHRGLGLALARQGRLDEAVEHLARVIELTPNPAELREKLGWARQLLEAHGHTANW